MYPGCCVLHYFPNHPEDMPLEMSGLTDKANPRLQGLTQIGFALSRSNLTRSFKFEQRNYFLSSLTEILYIERLVQCSISANKSIPLRSYLSDLYQLRVSNQFKCENAFSINLFSFHMKMPVKVGWMHTCKLTPSGNMDWLQSRVSTVLWKCTIFEIWGAYYEKWTKQPIED